MKIEQVAQALADWQSAKGKKKQEVAKAQFDTYLTAYLDQRTAVSMDVLIKKLGEQMRGF